MSNGPWATLMIRMTPKINASPSATIPYNTPDKSPEITTCHHRRRDDDVHSLALGYCARPSAGFAGAIFLGEGREERAPRRATTVGRGAKPPSESPQRWFQGGVGNRILPWARSSGHTMTFFSFCHWNVTILWASWKPS